MSPTSSLFLELNTAITMYDAMVHTSSPMLVSTRTRSALRGLWISALLYSLPLSVVLSKSSSNHECTLHKFLEDSIKTLISWLQHPTLQHRISLRWPFNPLSRSRPHQTYETIEDEAKYWESAERLQAQLFPYDARCTRAAAKAQKTAQSSQTRQILYYTPRLPPAYRETRETERDLEGSWISAKTVMKWHWLVFPDRVSSNSFAPYYGSQLTIRYINRYILQLWRLRAG